MLVQFLSPAVGAGQSLPLGALPHPSFSSPTINNHAKLVSWKLLQLVNNLSTATCSVLGSHTGQAELCLGYRRLCSQHSGEKAPLCPRINKIITETLPCSLQFCVLPTWSWPYSQSGLFSVITPKSCSDFFHPVITINI